MQPLYLNTLFFLFYIAVIYSNTALTLISNSSDIYACPNEAIQFKCVGNVLIHYWRILPYQEQFYLFQSEKVGSILLSHDHSITTNVTSHNPFTTTMIVPYNLKVNVTEVSCTGDGLKYSINYRAIKGKNCIVLMFCLYFPKTVQNLNRAARQGNGIF